MAHKKKKAPQAAPPSYCDFAGDDPFHAAYHDHEYGVPMAGERDLFERLCLEIMQAGLSWHLILKRRKGMQAAFNRFDPVKISKYNAGDRKKLLADARIIRNRLKVDAIIENAKRVVAMRKTHKGFAAFLSGHHPKNKKEWVKLFKTTFKFTGGEIVNEFLMSIGYLPGAHRDNCKIHRRIQKDHDLPWLDAQKKGFRYD